VAEEQDQSQKTEAPSQRRLEEARGKGQVVASREVSTLLLFTVSALLCLSVAPESARAFALAGRVFLAHAHALPSDGPGLARLLREVFGGFGAALALPFLAFLAAPVAATLLQNALVWTAEPLRPKLERVSPLAGAKRLFSARSFVEFGKSLAKLALVTLALYALLRPEAPAIVGSSRLAAGPFLAYLTDLAFRVLALIAVAAAIVAAIDYAHQYGSFMRQMRMSRRELQEEHKQSDGDPHVKQRFRALRLERSRRRMMADVPRSTVVIANPTHFAVALRYVAGETAAPEVLAKGVDKLALRIREVAAAEGIPVIENPPLARALHAACEVGELIPPAHYQAVAEIISYVLRLGERR
jgi:flagellar biosynthesis protein FlhB